MWTFNGIHQRSSHQVKEPRVCFGVFFCGALVCLLYSARTLCSGTLQPAVHRLSWDKKMSLKNRSGCEVSRERWVHHDKVSFLYVQNYPLGGNTSLRRCQEGHCNTVFVSKTVYSLWNVFMCMSCHCNALKTATVYLNSQWYGAVKYMHLTVNLNQ